MKAMVIEAFGKAGTLHWSELPISPARPGEPIFATVSARLSRT